MRQLLTGASNTYYSIHVEMVLMSFSFRKDMTGFPPSNQHQFCCSPSSSYKQKSAGAVFSFLLSGILSNSGCQQVFQAEKAVLCCSLVLAVFIIPFKVDTRGLRATTVLVQCWVLLYFSVSYSIWYVQMHLWIYWVYFILLLIFL